MPYSQLENVFLYDVVDPYFEIFENQSYRFGVYSSRNPHNTSVNEDVLFFRKLGDKLIFGVADGAGGHPRGRDAAFTICEEIQKDSGLSMSDKIEEANQKVLDMKVGAKSTLAVSEINDDDIRFYTVGDSEILYWNSNAREIYSSLPYSPAGLKVEAGVTSQEESLTDPERHIVMSLMGDEFVQIHATTKIKMKKGHSVLIGTDGIFDNISHQELSSLVSGSSYEESFEKIVNLCKEANPEKWIKNDDIAFIFLRKIKA